MDRGHRRRPAIRRIAGIVAALCGAAAVRPPAAAACDVCAVYTATEMGESRTGFRIGIAEQYSHFTTLKRDGEEIDNVADERLTSAITQVLLGYGITPRLGVQVNLPFIVRKFRRLEPDGRVERGDETGIGDLSLLGHLLAYSDVTEDTVFRFTVLGGVKFPTGDSDRLAEELRHAEEHAEDETGAAAHAVLRRIRPRHTPPPPTGGGGDGGGAAEAVSGVHGHDLALGSGSFDGIVGASVFWSWKRLFTTAALQWAIRTEGDFDYEYADDLTWAGGPGVFVLLTHRYSLGLQAVLAGETKGKDEQQDVRLDDTGITALYAGPAVLFTWGTSLAADVTLDVPAIQENTAVQIVPDYRIRGGVTWRF